APDAQPGALVRNHLVPLGAAGSGSDPGGGPGESADAIGGRDQKRAIARSSRDRLRDCGAGARAKAARGTDFPVPGSRFSILAHGIGAVPPRPALPPRTGSMQRDRFAVARLLTHGAD